MDLIDFNHFPNYLPISIRRHALGHAAIGSTPAQNRPAVDWCDFGTEATRRPFFADDAHHQLQKPFNRQFRPYTGIETLLSRAEELDQSTGKLVMPAGFIFHVSRCGSTLLCQQLAQLPQHLVLSEATAIDHALALDCNTDEVSNEQLLRAAVLAVCAKRDAHWRSAWIKFDAWHALEFQTIRRCFPDVPWVFLYRDPLEVLHSNLVQRAGHTLPGAGRLPYGMNLMQAVVMPSEEFVALKIREIMEAALNFDDARGLFINYQDLPEPGFRKVLEHFQLRVNAAELTQMQSASRMHAKQPGLAFTPDAARKHDEASELTKSVSQQLLWPLYQALEQRRWRPT